MDCETSLIVFASLCALFGVAVQLNIFLRRIFGDTINSRLRDFVFYFVICFAASCVAFQFEILLPAIGSGDWLSSFLVFLGTKVFPALSLFTFICILFLLVKIALRHEEYPEEDPEDDYELDKCQSFE